VAVAQVALEEHFPCVLGVGVVPIPGVVVPANHHHHPYWVEGASNPAVAACLALRDVVAFLVAYHLPPEDLQNLALAVGRPCCSVGAEEAVLLAMGVPLEVQAEAAAYHPVAAQVAVACPVAYPVHRPAVGAGLLTMVDSLRPLQLP